MNSLVDELHMSAGIQRAIENDQRPLRRRSCAGRQVRLSGFAQSRHTPTAGQPDHNSGSSSNHGTHMRLNELDGESRLADTCNVSKGTEDESGPVRPAATGRRVRRMRAAASRAIVYS